MPANIRRPLWGSEPDGEAHLRPRAVGRACEGGLAGPGPALVASRSPSSRGLFPKRRKVGEPGPARRFPSGSNPATVSREWRRWLHPRSTPARLPNGSPAPTDALPEGEKNHKLRKLSDSWCIEGQPSLWLTRPANILFSVPTNAVQAVDIEKLTDLPTKWRPSPAHGIIATGPTNRPKGSSSSSQTSAHPRTTPT